MNMYPTSKSLQLHAGGYIGRPIRRSGCKRTTAEIDLGGFDHDGAFGREHEDHVTPLTLSLLGLGNLVAELRWGWLIRFGHYRPVLVSIGVQI
jgi:hypothetical protein